MEHVGFPPVKPRPRYRGRLPLYAPKGEACCICFGDAEDGRWIDPHGYMCGSCTSDFFEWKRAGPRRRGFTKVTKPEQLGRVSW